MTTTIHPDDIAVDNFAAAMKLKLAAARDKGRSGWDNKELCSGEYLAQNLVVHLSRGNAGTFEDIANFAMMLHQRGEDPALLKTKVDLNARVLAEGVLNKVADKWAAELTEKTEISQVHLDTENRTNGERLADAIFTDVMSDPALQSLMAAEFKISALTAQLQEANKVIDHIALAVGCEKDRMACWESVDAMTAHNSALIDQMIVCVANLKAIIEFSRAKTAMSITEVENVINESIRVMESMPAQSLTAHDAEVSAKAVMGFAEIIRGAYSSGFSPAALTVYDVYQAARNHVFSSYETEAPIWNDEDADAAKNGLTDILAEAGRAGFVAGIRLRSTGPCNDWHKAAEKYAASIVKAGAA